MQQRTAVVGERQEVLRMTACAGASAIAVDALAKALPTLLAAGDLEGYRRALAALAALAGTA